MLMQEILLENKQTLLSEINRYRLMYFGHTRHRDENKPQESNYRKESGGGGEDSRCEVAVDRPELWELTAAAKRHCRNGTGTRRKGSCLAHVPQYSEETTRKERVGAGWGGRESRESKVSKVEREKVAVCSVPT